MPFISDCPLSGKIYYTEFGKDKRTRDNLPFLFIHGAGCRSNVFSELLPLLGQKHWVVALDLPGHGRSSAYFDWPDSQDLLGIYVKSVQYFAEKLGLGRYTAVGHSMGGAIAQLLAIEESRSLKELVLIASGARLRISRAFFEMVDNHFDSLATSFGISCYSPASPAASVERWAREQLAVTKDIFEADFRACATFDIREQIHTIDVPTLILGGRDDLITPLRMQEEQHLGSGQLSGYIYSRFEKISRAGHFLMRERPDRVVEAIERLRKDPPKRFEE